MSENTKTARRRRRFEDPVPTCATAGCGRPTSERKPLCIECIDKLPYVARLSAMIAERDAEATAKASGIDLGGSRVQEILNLLAVRGCAIPLSEVAKAVEVPLLTADRYVGVMASAGLLSRVRIPSRNSKKGRPHGVVLTEMGRARAVKLDGSVDDDEEQGPLGEGAAA